MANKNRNKGIYHEKWFETWLKKIGMTVKRQPMSGALGGEYIGDLLINHNDQRFICEVKYRDKSNFPSPYTVLDKRDIAFYKRRTGSPQTLVIMTGEQFLTFMENAHGKSKQNDKSLP